jgi:hypothetical protein
MRILLTGLLALAPLSAFGSWEVKSEFQLHLSESLFDKTIEDFQQSLAGQRTINVGDITITPSGIPINIHGIRVDLNYAFAPPKRVDSTHREWELDSTNVSAVLHADSIDATQTIEKVVDGTVIQVNVSASCSNVNLTLPPGLTSIQAVIDATVAQNQVQLSMPKFSANWQQGAWTVSGMTCQGDTAGFGDIVRQAALAYFSTFQNMDQIVKTELNTQFTDWSQKASLLLLSSQDLPSGVDYLNIHYLPASAREAGDGLILEGVLDFVYPYVAQGQTISQEFQLSSGSELAGNNPQLLIPFGTIRALMMGEYFAGKLAYGLRSPEVPAFQSLMGNFFERLFGFPDLLRYSASDVFLFQVVPAGPPAFTGEANAGNGTIAGNVVMPISVKMYAPIGDVYWPYVEFDTTLLGPATMQLGQNGIVNFKINAQSQPVTYAWSQRYETYYRPNTYIAIDTIGASVRDSLNQQGLALHFPTFTVGQSMQLVPSQWQLDQGGNLVVDFTANLKPVK